MSVFDFPEVYVLLSTPARPYQSSGNQVLGPFIRYRRFANDVKRRWRGRDKSTGIEAQASEVQNFLSYSCLWPELPFWTGYQLALTVP